MKATIAMTSPIRILIVEDHRMNQIVLVGMLERLGQSPDVAGDGREAVDAVMGQPYDLVLMDVQMPHLDGLSAAREIRRLALEVRPYIVGLSADASVSAQSQCHEAGMDAYLPKPVSPEELAGLLDGFSAT